MKNSLLKCVDNFYEPLTAQEQLNFSALIQRYILHFDKISHFFYEKINPDEQVRFLIWFLKRWANIDRIDRNELSEYVKIIQDVKSQICERYFIGDKSYKLMDMVMQGYNAKLIAYDWVLAVHDFYYDQYRNNDVGVFPGDVIIDAGAFIGDTAVLFDLDTGGDCFIHSFELLDENIELFHNNCKLNNVKNYVLNKLALSDTSGDKVNVKQTPLQGATSIFGNEGDEQVDTVSIDDYVHGAGLERINFIKMDIEGAERFALKGAYKTIQRFKPRMAICVYHCWDDVIELPKIIDETGVTYQYSFKWVQLFNGWEAVIFANPV